MLSSGPNNNLVCCFSSWALFPMSQLRPPLHPSDVIHMMNAPKSFLFFFFLLVFPLPFIMVNANRRYKLGRPENEVINEPSISAFYRLHHSPICQVYLERRSMAAVYLYIYLSVTGCFSAQQLCHKLAS